MKISNLELSDLTSSTRYNPDHFMDHYIPLIIRDIGEIELSENQWVAATCLPKAGVLAAVTRNEHVEVPLKPGGEHPYVLMGTTTDTGLTVFGAITGFSGNSDTCSADDCWVLIITEEDPRKSPGCCDRDIWGNPIWTILKVGQ